MLARHFLHAEVATILVCGGTLTGTDHDTVSSLEFENDRLEVVWVDASKDSFHGVILAPSCGTRLMCLPTARAGGGSGVPGDPSSAAGRRAGRGRRRWG